MMPVNCLKLSRYLPILGFLHYSITVVQIIALEDTYYIVENKSGIFSPRLDYEEWTPLGPGDPLKNDPTFDYVPPVLDRVQYWVNSYTTEASIKQDSLVLGVTVKKTSMKNPNQFFKLMHEPNMIKKEDNISQNYLNGNFEVELTKTIRATNFHKNVNFNDQNKIQPLNYNYNQKLKSYTVIPPVILKQKNNPIYNNYNNFSNIKYYFDLLHTKFNTQTEKSTLWYKLKQYNNEKQKDTYQNQNLTNYSKYFLKLKEETDIPEIETIRNFTPTQHLSPKVKTIESTTLFDQSNQINSITYQSTQISLEGFLRAKNIPSHLLQRKTNYLSNYKNYKLNRAEYEVEHHSFSASNHKALKNSSAIIYENSNNIRNIINLHKNIQKESNNNIYKNNFSAQKIIPQFILLNKNNSTTNHSDNTFLNFPNRIQIFKSKYNKQLRNSTTIEKLNISKNLSNFFINNMKNNINQSIQIPKLKFSENFSNNSSLITASSKMYSSQPFLLDNFIKSHYFDLSLHPVKTTANQQIVTNRTSTYTKDIPLNIQHFSKQQPINLQKFTAITNLIEAPSILELHSINVQSVDQYKQNSFSKSTTLLPVLQLPLSLLSSTSKFNFNKRKTNVQYISPQIIQNNYKTKTRTHMLPMITTTLPYIQTTVISSLTTDPIFSHYKQPNEIIKGPMYIIIEGHSKVKTYKPFVGKHKLLIDNSKIINNTWYNIIL